MRIWVDADGCPNVIREILYRAANRGRIELTLVANRALTIPPSRFIKSIQVQSGFDVTDNEIVRKVISGDLVVTSDIPLAAEVVARGGAVLDTRGELYTADNISERLAMRNLMQELRSAGIETGGPASMTQGDRQAFAGQLDRILLSEARRRSSDE